MSKRKMSCQILHLENLEKHLNKLWYWDPDRLLSQRTGNGKRKGYWSSKLILKSKSGLNRLIAPNTESKFAALGKTSTYIYTEISAPKPVKPFCFTRGESYDPLISTTILRVKGQESWIISQKAVPKLPNGTFNNMFKQNSAREKHN